MILFFFKFFLLQEFDESARNRRVVVITATIALPNVYSQIILSFIYLGSHLFFSYLIP